MAQVIGISSGYLERKWIEGMVLLWVIFVAVEGSVVFMFLMSLNLRGDRGDFGIGLAMLALLLLLMIGTWKPLGELMDQSFPYLYGKRGEDAAQVALEKLPDGYLVFRDVRISDFWNIDLVVVGPNGVFAVEAKNSVGLVRFDGDGLSRNGRPFIGCDPLRQAMCNAVSLNEFLESEIGERVFVTPVLLFPHRNTLLNNNLEPVKGVRVVRPEFVNRVIESRGDRFAPEKVAAIAEVLRRTVTVG